MAFSKYADFSGRSTRNEYWWFVLANFLAMMVISILGGLIGGLLSFVLGDLGSLLGIGLLMIYTVATIIPSLSVLVRRLHDVGKSGWFYFIALIPLVGSIILLVFLAKESEAKTNKWGPVPGHSSSAGLADTLIDYDKEIV